MKDDVKPAHQSTLLPADNKFHLGNGSDGKHYWLTPPDLYATLSALHGPFDFDPCPFPKPAEFDGLTCEWGASSYVNPPFGSILHQGPGDKKPKKKGPTAWARKAITEAEKGKKVVLVYPVDKWLLMLLAAGAKVSNLGDVRWHATEDGSVGKGTGRHIACFVLDGTEQPLVPSNRFMTVEERYKYVGAITESMLDEAVIDAESASRVYDATCDAEDLKTLLEDLVSGLHLDDVVARLRGISRFVRGENKDEIEDIANGLEAAIAHVESGIGAIENKLDELKRSLWP